MKFKVLRGKHAEGGKVYKQGDIVDSKSNLNKLNSPGAIKFQQIIEESKTQVAVAVEEPPTVDSSDEDEDYTREELEQFKVGDLKGIAEELGIDLSEAKKKDEIISAILGE